MREKWRIDIDREEIGKEKKKKKKRKIDTRGEDQATLYKHYKHELLKMNMNVNANDILRSATSEY